MKIYWSSCSSWLYPAWKLEPPANPARFIAVLGGVAQSFVEDLKAKTKRGMTGKVMAGLAAGGLGYGYRVLEDAEVHGHREIVEEEAGIVRRIFRMYASGQSPRAIAAQLSKDHIPGPGGGPWIDTTIRGQVDRGTGLLNNSSYVGETIWNRCDYVVDPKTGKRVARPNPPELWERFPCPDLRIVNDELWSAVKAKQRSVPSSAATSKAMH